MRDLKLLRETLSSDEVAAALAARANMVIRARGIALEQLDYRSVSVRHGTHADRMQQMRQVQLMYSYSAPSRHRAARPPSHSGSVTYDAITCLRLHTFKFPTPAAAAGRSQAG